MAGQNRSPTIVWLYLLACSLPPEEAREIIERRAWDAIPGHSRLVDTALIENIQKFGQRCLRPHPYPEALEPADFA